MQIGSLVIANDLLGFVVSIEENTVGVKDKEGKVRTIKSDVCHEIANPHSLSLLVLNKLKASVKR